MIQTEWDLSQIYKTNDDFFNDVEKTKKLIKNLEKFKNKLNKIDKKIILDYFKKDEELSIIVEKLAVYAHCKNDDNGKNDTNIRNYQTINSMLAEASQMLAFAKPELSQLDDEFLNELVKDAEFSRFTKTLKDIIRYKAHTLSEKEEAMLSSVSSFEDTSDIFSSLTDIEMDHGSYINEKGEEVKLNPGNYSASLNNPSSELRKTILETYLGSFGKLNLTLSNLYLSHVKYMNFMAKAYKYESALDMSTFDEELSNLIIHKNIENVSSKAYLLQEYFRVKKDILGLKEFSTADIPVDLFLGKPESIPYEKAVGDIKESFKVLGEDYVTLFEKALSTGWIDAYPRENKASGGYTISAYSEHPYILLNYDGTSHWASAIAHEFGHAMHSYYAGKAQPYDKHQYTLFIAEVASLTNEVLLNHYQISKETDKNKKMQLLADFMQLFYLNVYNSSMLAELELYVHETLDEYKPLTGEDINKKFISLCTKYFGEDVYINKNFEYDWSRKSHIFRDYYLYKYSNGLICACGIARKILEDKTGEYLAKYKQFLSLGGSLDPLSLLKVAEIDVLDSKTYTYAFGLFENYLNQLKNLTEEKK